MRRGNPEERYFDNLRKQRRELEEFAAQELEWSKNLMAWYKFNKKDMPDDEYRACAYFINKEYQRKIGSLTLLYMAFIKWSEEAHEVTKENAFDVLRYKYKLFFNVLEKGGY